MLMKKMIYLAERVFTGDGFIDGYGVEVLDGLVSRLVPAAALPEDVPVRRLKGLLAPAFIDLQIYGGGGQLFSMFPSVESLRATYAYCVSGGAAHFMATVATNAPEVTQAAIGAVRAYQGQGLPGLLGLHLEGPYLNPEKKGAHLARHIRRPATGEVAQLLRAGEGSLRMMTLAPECCSPEVISLLIAGGILVSAGHSNASYRQGCDAFARGIPLATHLYNAMSPLSHREPGLVGAIFDSGACSSIVADGIHVDYAAVRIARRIMGERLFLITDAVTEAVTGAYTYIRRPDRYVTENGTLAGSCLTMGRAVANVISHDIAPAGEALRMGSLYPARAAGVQDRLGRIAPGWQADMVLLDSCYQVTETIVSGRA
jgi:N-acetylglucosamine-6-phosphate deacetylase